MSQVLAALRDVLPGRSYHSIIRLAELAEYRPLSEFAFRACASDVDAIIHRH